MSSVSGLLAVAGWEERFVEGIARDLAQYSPDVVCVLTFQEFDALTVENRRLVKQMVQDHGSAWHEIFLHREPKETWTQLNRLGEVEGLLLAQVALDITTMPREVIWWTLGLLRRRNTTAHFVYHKAQAYSSDWLTRDTGEPRLLYQYSGIAKLGKPTCLVLLNGFDSDRSMQIIQYFEPALTLLGVQAGEQYENQVKNTEPAFRIARRVRAVKTFEVDAYCPDQGYAQLMAAVEPYRRGYNIIAASLGPKTSAIALFRLVSTYPEIALAYAPSREFNIAYSTGIGPSIEGIVEV